MPELRLISHVELQTHNTRESCWICLDGLVYDFTSFLSKHPGGEGILLQNAGIDATSIFRLYHPIEFVQQLPSGALIGRLKPQEQQLQETGKKTTKPNIPLSHILNVYDFARNARGRISKEAWDYVVSAADDEVTYRLNETAYEAWWIIPRVLVNVSGFIDTSVTLLGTKSASPIYISATAMGRLYHPDGEMAIARGADDAGIIQMCPTLGSCSIEEMAGARGVGQTQWFQLYVNQTWDITLSVIRRAEKAGMRALCVTVDVATMGKRERDQRNRLVSDLSHIQQTHDRNAAKNRGVGQSLSSFVFPGLDWGYLRKIRSATNLPILLKGIQTGDDAIRAYESGLCQGVIVSNHGGRQVDYARPTLNCLVEVVRALKGIGCRVNINFDVFVDGGIRRGTDIFKCLALGAKAVGIGRPSLFALGSHGSEGVAHLITLLNEELKLVMMHTGCTNLVNINGSMIESVNDFSRISNRVVIHESRL